MNEQIKQLAGKASKIARKEHPEIAKGTNIFTWFCGGPEFEVFTVTEYDIEKLVELVIEETITIMGTKGSNKMSKKIKQHFGLEE